MEDGKFGVEAGKFYKTKAGETWAIYEVSGRLYGFWHEQMLFEPNHGGIEFERNGRAIYRVFLTDEVEYMGEEYDLVREVTKEELAVIEKEIRENE